MWWRKWNQSEFFCLIGFLMNYNYWYLHKYISVQGNISFAKFPWLIRSNRPFSDFICMCEADVNENYVIFAQLINTLSIFKKKDYYTKKHVYQYVSFLTLWRRTPISDCIIPAMEVNIQVQISSFNSGQVESKTVIVVTANIMEKTT